MKPQLKTWYKHRGSLFFVYPIHIEEFYDESGFVVDYIEVYVKDDKIYAWISNYSTNSLFASRLYKITNPRLIPRDDLLAKFELLDGDRQYTTETQSLVLYNSVKAYLNT